MSKMIPNQIICRIPSEDETHTFVELEILDYDDGTSVVQRTGNVFSVDAGDNYEEMTFAHIVLGHKVAEGSIDLMRYEVKNKTTGELAVVCKLPYDQLVEIVSALVEEYEAENAE